MRYEWDEQKASENLRKHGVSFEEAKEVFNDLNRIKYYDAEHSEEENRFLTIGFSSRLCFLSFIANAVKILRALSAREK